MLKAILDVATKKNKNKRKITRMLRTIRKLNDQQSNEERDQNRIKEATQIYTGKKRTFTIHQQQIVKKDNKYKLEGTGTVQQFFGKYCYVLRDRGVPLHLKTKLFNFVMIPVLTYGAQIQMFTSIKSERAIEPQMLCITLKGRKLNEWVRNKTKVQDVIEKAAKLKQRWAGHIEGHQDQGWNKEIGNWFPYLEYRTRDRPQK